MIYEYKTYQKLDKNLDPIVMKKLRKLFSDKDFNLLNEVNYNSNHFYGLPQVQRFQLITNVIKEQNSEYVNIEEPLDLKYDL